MREKYLYAVILLLVIALTGVSGYLVASMQGLIPYTQHGQPSQPTSPYIVRVVEQGEGTQLKTIVVAGLGIAVGKPNQAVLSLGATTEASTASEAVAKNGEIMNEVIDALKAVIPEKDIETASFSLYPRYSYDGRETIVGFEATHMLKVTTADMEKVGQFIDKAVDAGANRVEGVYFTFTQDKLAELNTLARQRAVDDARAKAETVADSLGVKIVGVASAIEGTYYQYPYRYEYAIPAPTPTPMPIMPPTELEISVMVEVTFMIE